jgi:hypothetical protein
MSFRGQSMGAKDQDYLPSEFRVKLECRVISYCYMTGTDITAMMTQSLSFLLKKQTFFGVAKTHLRF